MSDDIFQEKIDWAQVIPEIEKHIAKSDAEFEGEWEGSNGGKTQLNLAKMDQRFQGHVDSASRSRQDF